LQLLIAGGAGKSLRFLEVVLRAKMKHGQLVVY
jgi:hypothetical protein